MLGQSAKNPASICAQDSAGTVCRRFSSVQKPSLPWSSRAMQRMWIFLYRTASPGADGTSTKNMCLSKCGNRLRKASLLKHGCDHEIKQRVGTWIDPFCNAKIYPPTFTRTLLTKRVKMTPFIAHRLAILAYAERHFGSHERLSKNSLSVLP